MLFYAILLYFYICFILVIKIKIAFKWFTAFVIYLLLFIYKDLFKYVLDTRFIKGRYLWWSSPLCLLSIFIHLYFWNSYLYTHMLRGSRLHFHLFFILDFPRLFFSSLSLVLSIYLVLPSPRISSLPSFSSCSSALFLIAADLKWPPFPRVYTLGNYSLTASTRLSPFVGLA